MASLFLFLPNAPTASYIPVILRCQSAQVVRAHIHLSVYPFFTFLHIFGRIYAFPEMKASPSLSSTTRSPEKAPGYFHNCTESV